MTPGELIDIFRTEMADTLEPYLWSDSELLGYLDDAQTVYAQLTGGFADSTSTATKITIVAGKDWYAISPRILKLRRVTRTDTGREIPVWTAEQAELRGVRFDGLTGPIRALVSGLEDQKLRAWPMPSEASVPAELRILRLPLSTISDVDSRIEVPLQHRVPMLNWVKSRAHRKPDAETLNPVKADAYEQAFRRYCVQASAELARQRRPSGTVHYGGL